MVFFIALPLGIVIIAIGAIVFGLEFVGAGLMFGGVGLIIYGVGGFWRFAQDWLKFTLSAIGLVIVIYLGYRFNKMVRR
jgi:membrane protein implicated in regulation of membrane protease activity